MAANSPADSHIHVLTVVVGLAPTLIGAGIKWMQDNSQAKRRYQLADRLDALTKSYAEQNMCSDELVTTARAVLSREIKATCTELEQLQGETKRVSQRTGYGWLRDSFLLFLPRGVVAWIVHLVFYSGVFFLSLGILGIATESDREAAKYGVVGIVAFGIVLLLLQRLGIWLRKRHDVRCAGTISEVHP